MIKCRQISAEADDQVQADHGKVGLSVSVEIGASQGNLYWLLRLPSMQAEHTQTRRSSRFTNNFR